jgi:RNA polymerase primary sigma factor
MIYPEDFLYEKYIKEIEKYKVLTPLEELNLFISYKNGNEEAGNKIIEHNLKYVVSVARRYKEKAPLEDLINQGNLGLIIARDRFDETRGFKFISYATWWIEQKILEYLDQKAKMIRIPSSQKEEVHKIAKKISLYFQENQTFPQIEELLEEENFKGGIKENPYLQRIAYGGNSISYLEEEISSKKGESKKLKDTFEDLNFEDPVKSFEKEYLKKVLIELMEEKLTEKEIYVLKESYGLNEEKVPKSLDEISSSFNLSRERIRQIKEKALRKLRSPLSIKRLRDYL